MRVSGSWPSVLHCFLIWRWREASLLSVLNSNAENGNTLSRCFCGQNCFFIRFYFNFDFTSFNPVTLSSVLDVDMKNLEPIPFVPHNKRCASQHSAKILINSWINSYFGRTIWWRGGCGSLMRLCFGKTFGDSVLKGIVAMLYCGSTKSQAILNLT